MQFNIITGQCSFTAFEDASSNDIELHKSLPKIAKSVGGQQ